MSVAEEARRKLIDALARPDGPRPFGDAGLGGVAEPGASAVAAAVLAAALDRPDGPTIVLTERARRLAHHAGQVSFPGGRIEASDAGPVAAALREAEEEIGLEPGGVEVIGALPRYRTVTGFSIEPIVAWVARPPSRFEIDPAEVEAVFELPLAVALDERRYRRGSYRRGAHRAEFSYLPWAGRRIWGATAAILAAIAQRAREIER